MIQTREITNNERIIYSLNVEDIQRVANDELARDLTADEIKMVEEKVGDYISWYDAIALVIEEVITDKSEKD